MHTKITVVKKVLRKRNKDVTVYAVKVTQGRTHAIFAARDCTAALMLAQGFAVFLQPHCKNQVIH